MSLVNVRVTTITAHCKGPNMPASFRSPFKVCKDPMYAVYSWDEIIQCHRLKKEERCRGRAGRHAGCAPAPAIRWRQENSTKMIRLLISILHQAAPKYRRVVTLDAHEQCNKIEKTPICTSIKLHHHQH